MNRYVISFIFFISVVAQSIGQTPSAKLVNEILQRAECFKQEGRYGEARKALQEAVLYSDVENKEKVLSKLALAWYYEAADHTINEKFHEALACFEEALNSFQQLGSISGEKSALQNIAWIYSNLGMNSDAISFYATLLELLHDNEDAYKMSVAKELCQLNDLIGNMDEKLRYSNYMYTLYHKTNDLEAHYTYCSYNGNESQRQGRYDIAEQWFLKGLEIAKIQSGKENSNSNNEYISYLDLGSLYSKMGRYQQANDYLTMSLGNDIEININNYLIYLMLADNYLMLDDIARCKKYIDDLSTFEKHIDEPRVLGKLHSLRGSYYTQLKEYQKSLNCYKIADEILSSKYHENDEERTILYAMIGGVAHKLKNYKESELYYKKYAESIEHTYGKESLKYINSQVYLANAQAYNNNIKEGVNNYKCALEKLKNAIRKLLPYMNTAERESFWTPISSLLLKMTPYALSGEQYQSDYTRHSYDALILSKGFLLASEQSIYGLLKKDGDESDMKIYRQIVSLTENIKEWKNYPEQFADSLLVKIDAVDQMEETLLKNCKSIGEITSFVNIDYYSVKKALKKNDVLIDFTDFISESGDRQYAAYIINNKQKFPQLKSLFVESQIESLGIVRPDMFYVDDLSADFLDLIWNPLKDELKEGATVYYVPSQMLFQVSLESLPLKDGTLLGDHYHFVRLSSARELVYQPESNKINNVSAVLYGGLEYDMKPEIMIESAKQYDLSSLELMRSQNSDYGEYPFEELPYSQIEVDEISKLLAQSNIEITKRVGIDGTEESFMSLHCKSPSILHIATHGFYYPSTVPTEQAYFKVYSDAMSRSGLIMSGGNAGWRGEKVPEGVLGGVLTANDIASLDLSNVDMVVLSACHSGQGESTSEGLYGLQRAFKKAGVHTIVMSLWEVSDIKATEFMVEFYKALNENSWNKREAFKVAQKIIRDRYPDPYYWASFVMLD